ncbi:MAG: DUF2378 family protein [Archangium sp.]
MTVPVEQRLVFSHTVEGLFLKAFKERMTDRLRERVRTEAKIDLRAKLEPAVSISTWWKCLELCAQELFPEKTMEDAVEHIGLLLTRGYFETLVGSALKGILRVIGPSRALKRMDRSLRSGNNYAEIEVTELAPTRFRFWCNEVGTSRYVMLGLIKGGAEVSGAKNCDGQITAYDDRGVTIEVWWDP